MISMIFRVLALDFKLKLWWVSNLIPENQKSRIWKNTPYIQILGIVGVGVGKFRKIVFFNIISIIWTTS